MGAAIGATAAALAGSGAELLASHRAADASTGKSATPTPTPSGKPIGDGSTADTGPQPHQPRPQRLAPGEEPPQFVVMPPPIRTSGLAVDAVGAGECLQRPRPILRLARPAEAS